MKIRVRVMVAAILMSAACVAIAQVETGDQIAVGQHADFGAHLVDADGFSVYVFTDDEEETSTCVRECAAHWPPVAVSGEPTAGSGVAQSLLGTLLRDDGTVQVTYNGRPLYRYEEDAQPGDATGHGWDGRWFLVSPYGEALEAPSEPTEDSSTASAEPVSDEVMSHGQDLFAAHCAACHGTRGDGGAGPSLRGNADLEDEQFVVRQVTHGSSHMPGFGNILSDSEIAANVTFVRNSWGNDYGLTEEEEVAAQR